MQESFDTKIGQHIRALKPVDQVAESVEIRVQAKDSINHVASSGFSLDPQQASAFSLVSQSNADSAFKQKLDAMALIRQAKGIHTNF